MFSLVAPNFPRFGKPPCIPANDSIPGDGVRFDSNDFEDGVGSWNGIQAVALGPSIAVTHVTGGLPMFTDHVWMCVGGSGYWMLVDFN